MSNWEPFPNWETGYSLVCFTAINPQPYKMQHPMNSIQCDQLYLLLLLLLLLLSDLLIAR